MFHQPTNSKSNFNYNACVYTDTVWQTHFHKNFELIYVLKGALTVRKSSRDIFMGEGELLLVMPNEGHSFTVDGSTEVWVGVFSEDFVSRFSKQYEDSSYDKFTCEAEVESFLKKKLFSKAEPQRFMLISCLYAVCDQCVKYAKRAPKNQNSDVTERVLEYVSRNFAENISLEMLSGHLGYEYHYFSKMFHDCFCVNFREFLNIYRFEHACEMLCDGNRELTKIAMESGFGSIRNFNRVFKSLSGVTPHEYRQSILK